MSARAVVALVEALASTTPTDSVPPPSEPVLDTSKSTGAAVWDVVKNVFEALGDNGYQTGSAIIVATVALVALINLGTNKFAIGAVSIGAFWAGWLGWNTFTSSNNQLFPGDIQATKLWDVAFTSDIGFLIVAIVASILAAMLWRKGMSIASRVVVLIGGVLGASLIYNVYESVQSVSSAAG